VEDYQQRIQQLEEENRKLTEMLPDQTDGGRSVSQDVQLKQVSQNCLTSL